MLHLLSIHLYLYYTSHNIYIYIYIYILYSYVYIAICIYIAICKSLKRHLLFLYTYIFFIHTFQPLFMYHYFYYVHLFLENSSIFSHYFFTDVFRITCTITYSKKLHTLKTSSKSFCVILGMILVVLLYLMIAVKPFLEKVCKDFFYITLSLLLYFLKGLVCFHKIL